LQGKDQSNLPCDKIVQCALFICTAVVGPFTTESIY